MSQITRFVGLDVHKHSITVAVAEEGRGEARLLGRYPNDLPRLLKLLGGLGVADELLCAYEAGPTGFVIQRELARQGLTCEVIAPSKTPERHGDRVKTDRRDAVRLAHFLRSGDLVAVHVPDEKCEAMRDLLRARDDAKHAQLQARHRLSKFLDRQGMRFPGKAHWTLRHLDWVRTRSFEYESQQRVLEEYIQSVNELTTRIERHDQLLERLAPQTEQASLIVALQAFRGIRLLTASAFAYELGDFHRFPTPGQLAGFLGVVPSEDSSGDKRRRGSITKAGNRYLRRLVIEAAWSYRFRPAVTVAIRKRSENASPEVKAVAWRAQQRLHQKYVRLKARGKTHQKTLVAVARELICFLWEAARQEVLVTN